MPADEHDERSSNPSPEDTGAVKFEEAPGGPPPPAPLSPKGRARWRRVVNRRNAMWTAIVAVVAVLALALILFILYRSGRVDSIISDQIVSTFAKYGIRAEIEGFETQIGARTAVLTNLVLYDQRDRREARRDRPHHGQSPHRGHVRALACGAT